MQDRISGQSRCGIGRLLYFAYLICCIFAALAGGSGLDMDDWPGEPKTVDSLLSANVRS
jgi:hypothetical protein